MNKSFQVTVLFLEGHVAIEFGVYIENLGAEFIRHASMIRAQTRLHPTRLITHRL